jgi:parvulin-like peptidyl-prolyl isomerase
MATVDGVDITGQDYAKYLGTRQAILAHQLSLMNVTVPTPVPAATPAAGATPAPQPTPTQDQVLLQQLQSEQANLSSSGINQLVEAHLLLDQAKAKNIAVSQAELDDARRWMMSAPTSVSQDGTLEMMPTPLPTKGIVSLGDAQQALKTIVGNGRFLSAAQIDELILKPAVIKAKLVAQLSPNVPTTEEEVHARHILIQVQNPSDDAQAKAKAQDVLKQLQGGADFATLAAKYSDDPGSKDKGGDLGWFGKGQMVPEFEQAAFSLQPRQISGLVKSQYGYHIIQVLEKDPHHPIDPARIQQLRMQPYQTWLNQATSDPTKVKLPAADPNLQTWVQNYVQAGQ